MNSLNLAKKIRIDVVNMVNKSGASHIGPILSIVDIIAVLYGKIMRYDIKNPKLETRDRFILSKGHGGAAVYASLAEVGFFDKSELLDYAQDGSKYGGHVSHEDIPGVEFSTGSLGHGLPITTGMALASKINQTEHRFFVLMSDGECDEGSNWEAIMFAAGNKVDNLIATVDYNKKQIDGSVDDVLPMGDIAEKFRAFGWEVLEEKDGNNLEEVEETLFANWDGPYPEINYQGWTLTFGIRIINSIKIDSQSFSFGD